ncbi:hypothetical protein BGZ65_010358, partial [Modicella reniformis]
NRWTSQVFKPKDAASTGGNSAGATDPKTGLIYIPKAAGGDAMAQINLKTKSSINIPMPKELKASKFFSVVWNTPLKGFLLIGGSTGWIGQLDRLNMYLYQPDKKKGHWQDISNKIQGTVIPAPRISACLASANDGNQLVYFGGYTRDKVSIHRDIHILDIKTMTWRKGTNISNKERRSEAACAVSGDQFVIWGGQQQGIPFNNTIVYNIKTNKWVKSFKAAVKKMIIPQ